MGSFKRSPLFYVGDKFKLLPEITKLFPQNIETFYEPFVGGGSVFLNVDATSYELNDIDTNVIQIHKELIKWSESEIQFFKKIENRVKKYGLSRSYIEDVVPLELKKEHKKTYYAKYNKESFNALKKKYNSSSRKDYLDLYILLIYGFNRMLRFNSKGEYNLPVGNVDFNKNVKNALSNYFAYQKGRQITFNNSDYKDFLKKRRYSKDDFIYFDPPYLITFSEYNKLWNDSHESNLLKLIDKLDSEGVRWAISNVTHYKDKVNDVFLNWSKKYNSHNIKSNYISYHDNTIKTFNEILITNY